MSTTTPSVYPTLDRIDKKPQPPASNNSICQSIQNLANQIFSNLPDRRSLIPSSSTIRSGINYCWIATKMIATGLFLAAVPISLPLLLFDLIEDEGKTTEAILNAIPEPLLD